MELYTLDDNYNRADIIEEYESAIWTERFIEPGDMKLILPATQGNYKLLTPGTLMGLRGSREVMILEDREIQDGMMTVNGKTLEFFFDERFIDRAVLAGPPGEILGDIVNLMQSRHERAYAIPRLRTGLLDDTDTRIIKVVHFGTVHTTLLELARKYNVGMGVYWVRDHDKHELVFSTRKGVDRTTNQKENELVRFSPNLDNLANVKELLSIADSKTTVIANPPNIPIAAGVPPMRLSSMPQPKASEATKHFKERILEISGSDITSEILGEGTAEQKRQALSLILYNRAKKALFENKKIRVVDGEITPNTRYRYGTAYHLGDLVEVEGYFGTPVKGLMNEYIRSNDGTGERAYPTVSEPSEPVYEIISPQ